MKHLTVPVTIIVSLVFFFVIIGHVSISYGDDVQAIQSESSTTKMESFISVPENEDVTDGETTVSKLKPNPIAVPVLTPEEAAKANKKALGLYRNKEFVKTFQAFITKNRNRISVVVSLLPLLFILDIIFFKRQKKKSCKAKEYFSLSRRIRILSSVSLLAFGLLVFVPWSVYFGNSQQFLFIFQDFFNWDLSILTISILVVSFILILIPATISDYLVALIAGLGLCVYVQAMFMNCYLGEMNGIEPEWGDHSIWGIVNIILWFVIFSIPFILKKVFSSFFSNVISATTGFVLLLEIIASLSLVASATPNVWQRNHNYCVDGTNQFQFSSNKNIIVFVFDALGSGYLHQCFSESPEYKKILKDFIWFTDARSNYNKTLPGLHHELTGTFIHPTRWNNWDDNDLFKDSWSSPSCQSFYKQIREAGFDTRLYINKPRYLGPEELYHDYFSNIVKDNKVYTVNNNRLVSCFIRIMGFSCLPYILKKHSFYDHTFDEDVIMEDENQKMESSISQNNDSYFNNMVAHGLSTDSPSPILAYHYTVGGHAPWYTNEKCRRTKTLDDPLPTVKGCLYLLSELIRLMKKSNIYDKTTILVCSDHGSYGEKYLTPFDMTFMIKPYNTSRDELLEDVSKVQSIDILPTLLQIACGNNADFSSFEGFPINNIPEGRQRHVYRLERWDLPYFCLKEYHFDSLESFDYKKSLLHLIPLNKEVDIDDPSLEKYRFK